MSEQKDWREYPYLDEVATEFKTVRDSGVTNMWDLRHVVELCRENGMYRLDEFVNVYGTVDLFQFLDTLDWDAVAVYENVLYELGG